MLRHFMTFLVRSSVQSARLDWAVAKRLRHRVLIPAFGGSNPPGPAILLPVPKRLVAQVLSAKPTACCHYA